MTTDTMLVISVTLSGGKSCLGIRQKDKLTFKGKERLSSEFLTAMLYARGKWNKLFKILKERKCESMGNMWIYIQYNDFQV